MRILILPGDGIGPEITGAAEDILVAMNSARGLDLSFDHDVVGFASLEKYGTSLRPELLTKADEYDGIILGPQSNSDHARGDRGVLR